MDWDKSKKVTLLGRAMKADLSDGRPFSSSKTTNVPFRRIWQQLGQLGAGGAAAEAAATAGGLGAAAGGESVTGG